MTTSQPPKLRHWLGLLGLGMIWGASFLAAKIALQSFEPLTIAAGRIGIAAVVLSCFAYLRGLSIPRLDDQTGRRVWGYIAFFGVFANAIPFSLLNWGQTYIASSFAGISMAMVPLLVLPLAHMMVQSERMSMLKVIGVLLGFLGVLILLNPREMFIGSGASLESLARLACFGAAVCYALSTVNTKRCPPVSTIMFSALGLIFGFICIVPIALLAEGIPDIPSLSAMLGLLYLGLLPTALATLLLVWIINAVGPTFLTSVSYQIPLWAVFFGSVVLNEILPASFFIAFILILGGLLLSQLRPRGI